MIAREAKERLETIPHVVSAARERSESLTGHDLYEAAHEALYTAVFAHSAHVDFTRARQTSEAQAVGRVLTFLRRPISDENLPLGSALEDIVDRREIIRAYLLEILPALNESLDLGIVFKEESVEPNG